MHFNHTKVKMPRFLCRSSCRWVEPGAGAGLVLLLLLLPPKPAAAQNRGVAWSLSGRPDPRAAKAETRIRGGITIYAGVEM